MVKKRDAIGLQRRSSVAIKSLVEWRIVPSRAMSVRSPVFNCARIVSFGKRFVKVFLVALGTEIQNPANPMLDNPNAFDCILHSVKVMSASSTRKRAGDTT